MLKSNELSVKNTHTQNRNAWVDTCRSTAIILVLLSHGRHFLTPAWPALGSFNVGGFLGVELFFVISGFLIGGIVRQEYLQAKSGYWVVRFWGRRWLRTLPNYYLFLLINAALIVFAIEPGNLSELVHFLYFAQNLAWPHPATFGEAWSLAVEEVFYFIFPLALLLSSKISLNRTRILLVVASGLLLMSLIARFTWVIMVNPSWDEGVRKVVLFRLDALMVGVFAGWAVPYITKTSKPWNLLVILLGIGLVGFSIGTFFFMENVLSESIYTRVWLFPLTSIGFGFAILAGLNSVILPRFLIPRIEYFARLSYALYLAHMPVFYSVKYYFGLPSPSDTVGAITRWLLFIVGSIIIAAIVEACYERPILRFRDRFLPS